MNFQYYRPEWTCGRFNKDKQVALMYNLIEGVSYFFESFSANVIGEVLSVKRNDQVDISSVCKQTGIAEESITPFFKELMNLGLLTAEVPSKEKIAEYRKKVGEYKRNQEMTVEKTVQEKLPYEISSAEMAYSEATGQVTSVMFELTYNCSEKCIHCYNPGATRNDNEKSGRGNRTELDLNDYKRIIDELYELGLLKVCLSGGDPFSKPIVWEIIDYLYNKEIAFDIFTNGQQLNGNSERLMNYYPRLVGISIYSAVDADHDSITRIKGSLQKSLSVIKQLSEWGVPMNLKCPIMRTNVKTYYTVADVAKRYGAVPQFEVCLTDSIDGDKCVSRYLRLTPEMLEIVLRDSNIPLYVGPEAPNFGGQPKQMDKNACGAADGSFNITPEGNIQPCCAFPLSFGNLKEKTFTEILEKSKELKYWKELTLKEYEECGKFDYCAYCNLCAGNNYIENSTPQKASENNCFIAKTRYNLAQKMMNGHDPLGGNTLPESLMTLNVEDRKIERVISE